MKLHIFIRRHKLITFFVLAFALSWLAWIPYVLSKQGLGVVPLDFPELLGTTQLLGVLPGAYLGPILSAFIVTAVAEGRPGLRRWTGRLLRWRVGWRWYVAVLLGVPVVLAVTTIPFTGAIAAPSATALAAYLPALVLQLLTTGLAEEPGWRDFALPHLQPRFGALRGTLVLGPLWGAWHLPLFLTEWGGWPHVQWETPLEFIAAATAFSFVMTWVFNRSGESLPVAMVLHTSVNNYFSVMWSDMFPGLGPQDTSRVLLVASAVVAVVIIALTRGRLGYRQEAIVTSTADGLRKVDSIAK
ncbi:membrane protease YdiL (CAAX protease family) [Amycolatopsis bartoniae]|uniref:CAAX amino protease n=1 Tax=Amycolatopsis bartoniae TaxID=941986 RepID=A0A8H9IZ90_9PSEU|nr:type II CAAX endopeptidase family protein [Amycolatopsis bartoniae]MBB2935062.1 membrane protease YdiL (CAAX protease family) [Amycolatopsis bartoniae]GHF74064.1 CAAX amino protease [Amycolatopsis bartoniae]